MNSSLSKNNVAVIIPFFNEAKTLKQVVNAVLEYSALVLCIDDGSYDASANTIENLNGVTIIRNEKNTGKGAALRRGFEWLLNNENIEAIITIDADLQHDPEFIPEFIAKMKEYDVVIGNRMHDLSSMPLHRILSNKITSALLSLKLGLKISDSQSGFRCYRRKVLKYLITPENGFEAESVHLINAARGGFKIGFVNIPVKYGNDSSKMRNFEATIGFIKVLFK